MSNFTMNTTTSSSDPYQIYLITLVNLLNKKFTQVGMGIIFVVGNVGSVLTCLVFCQATYRESPCAMYFLAASVSQFFTFNFALFTRMLHYGYDVLALNQCLWYCKIRFYLFYLFVAVPRYNIILASIDRYFASSRNALRRQKSSPKNAFRLIIGNVLFWCIVYVQILVFYEINNGVCSYRGGSYGMFFSTYIAVDSGILPLLLMLIFGVLTVRNVHQTRQRIDPGPGTAGGQAAKMSKKDAQLHQMLANQIALFIILNMPNPIFLVYGSFTVNMSKSALHRAIDAFLSNMTYLLVYLGFALTFTNFLVSSEIFRREFFQLLRTRILRRPPTGTTTGGGTTVRVLRTNVGEE